jgi:hypothetical protein
MESSDQLDTFLQALMSSKNRGYAFTTYRKHPELKSTITVKTSKPYIKGIKEYIETLSKVIDSPINISDSTDEELFYITILEDDESIKEAVKLSVNTALKEQLKLRDKELQVLIRLKETVKELVEKISKDSND